ncbi:hypothetical protein GCM10009805_26160 [Leucobacter chromiireducens subsp. solipictus]
MGIAWSVAELASYLSPATHTTFRALRTKLTVSHDADAGRLKSDAWKRIELQILAWELTGNGAAADSYSPDLVGPEAATAPGDASRYLGPTKK